MAYKMSAWSLLILYGIRNGEHKREERVKEEEDINKNGCRMAHHVILQSMCTD